MTTSCHASAPGKLMLMGEHAVLHGRLCLVAAVNRRLHVELTPRPDNHVRLESALGVYEGPLTELEVREPFTFVLAAIRRQKLTRGFDLRITSEFPEMLGLGSSAAVTVAVTAALGAFQGEDLSPQAVFNEALAVVREVQGTGSGADVAASVFGGVLAYRAEPLEIRQLRGLPPLDAVYSGAKAKTVDVIALVEEQRQSHPQLYDGIYDLMEAGVEAAIPALEQENWPVLGRLLNIQHGLMAAIGVSNAEIARIVHQLRADAGIFGAKISGAGLGDCVVGLGKVTNPGFPYEVLDLEVTPTGVQVELKND